METSPECHFELDRAAGIFHYSTLEKPMEKHQVNIEDILNADEVRHKDYTSSIYIHTFAKEEYMERSGCCGRRPAERRELRTITLHARSGEIAQNWII